MNAKKFKISEIVDDLHDGVTIQDKDGELIYVNKAAVVACGVGSQKDLLQKELLSLYKTTLSKFSVMDEDGNEFDVDQLPGRRALRGEQDPSAVIKYHNNNDGKTRWAQIRSKPIIDEEGQIVFAVNMITDITHSKHIEEVLNFKLEASKVLSKSLDYHKSLKRIATMAVPEFADWCLIDLHKEGKLTNLAIEHENVDKLEKAKMIRKKYPPDLRSGSGIAKVIRTGNPIYVKNIDDAMISEAAKDDKQIDFIKEFQINSVIIAPFGVQGKIVGAMTLITTGERELNDSDYELARLTAARISLAMERASLFHEVTNERKRLDKLLSDVPAVVWELWARPDQEKHRVNYVSKYLEDMLGYDVSEWLSSPNFWLEIIHPDDKKDIARQMANLYRSKGAGTLRYRWITKGNKPIWVESQIQVVRNTKGKPVGLRAVSTDISRRIEIEKRKDDFINMASHELKTPLTSIKLYLSAFESSLSGASRAKSGPFLAKVDRQISRLQRLVTELLNVSNIQAGKLELNKEKFLLDDLIKENIEEMRMLSNKDQIKLKGMSGRHVHADKDRVGQVLKNLFSNAIKFSQEDGEILVTVRPNGKNVVVGVQDKGIGIGKTHLNKVFDRFYRVYEDKEKTYPGMGMGLYISKEIIERHGGQIWLESEKGKGSRFYFSLPMIDK